MLGWIPGETRRAIAAKAMEHLTGVEKKIWPTFSPFNVKYTLVRSKPTDQTILSNKADCAWGDLSIMADKRGWHGYGFSGFLHKRRDTGTTCAAATHPVGLQITVTKRPINALIKTAFIFWNYIASRNSD
jgi:hypothetical protein